MSFPENIITINWPKSWVCPYCHRTFEPGQSHEIMTCLGEQVNFLKREVEILKSDIEMIIDYIRETEK